MSKKTQGLSWLDKNNAIYAYVITSPVKVGIGTGVAGFYARSDKDAELMAKASMESGDFVWKLPLFAGYRRLLSSSVADINHYSLSWILSS